MKKYKYRDCNGIVHLNIVCSVSQAMTAQAAAMPHAEVRIAIFQITVSYVVV